MRIPHSNGMSMPDCIYTTYTHQYTLGVLGGGRIQGGFECLSNKKSARMCTKGSEMRITPHTCSYNCIHRVYTTLHPMWTQILSTGIEYWMHIRACVVAVVHIYPLDAYITWGIVHICTSSDEYATDGLAYRHRSWIRVWDV